MQSDILLLLIVPSYSGNRCISLVLTWGLFQLKSWAWTGTLIVHVIATLAQLAKMFGSAGTAVNFLTLGFAIATIYYLLRSDVKQAFAIAP